MKLSRREKAEELAISLGMGIYILNALNLPTDQEWMIRCGNHAAAGIVEYMMIKYEKPLSAQPENKNK